jgi:hypothetical protein
VAAAAWTVALAAAKSDRAMPEADDAMAMVSGSVGSEVAMTESSKRRCLARSGSRCRCWARTGPQKDWVDLYGSSWAVEVDQLVQLGWTACRRAAGPACRGVAVADL